MYFKEGLGLNTTFENTIPRCGRFSSHTVPDFFLFKKQSFIASPHTQTPAFIPLDVPIVQAPTHHVLKVRSSHVVYIRNQRSTRLHIQVMLFPCLFGSPRRKDPKSIDDEILAMGKISSHQSQRSQTPPLRHDGHFEGGRSTTRS